MHIQCWRVNLRTVQFGRRSMLFIVVRRIRQCAELPVKTVYFNTALLGVMINVLTCNAVDRRFENPSSQTKSRICCFSAKTGH